MPTQTSPREADTRVTGQQWQQRYQASVMNTFGTPQRVLVRGSGARVWDADGNAYLDLLGGIAVNALGHAHPAVIEAVSNQLATLGHVSNFFTTPAQVALAERIIELTGGDQRSRVFFTNSGTEAIEGAIKAARKLAPSGERVGLVAAQGSFHGRSMGALSLTYKPTYRQPFAPLLPDVVHVPFGDEQALAEAVDGQVSAVVLEPIQGEGGVVAAPAGYLRRAREITSAAGALLILDEIQTGIGRTGTWLASANPALVGELSPGVPDAVRPDVLTLAKGLGGGIPIGALVAHGDASALLGPGDHGTTFGGNPVAAAAALATLDTIESEGLMENAVAVGAHLRAGVASLGEQIRGTRGFGLLIGIELAGPWSAALAASLLERGVIVNAVAPEVIRIAPPLILTPAEADEFVAALGSALSTLEI